MAIAGVGLVSSVLVFCIGLVPPSQFGTSHPALYALMLLGGTLILGVGIPALFLWLRKPSWMIEGEAAEEGGVS
jgi:hypothetical protein